MTWQWSWPVMISSRPSLSSSLQPTAAPDLIFPPPVIPTAPTVTDLSTVPASLVDHLYTAFNLQVEPPFAADCIAAKSLLYIMILELLIIWILFFNCHRDLADHRRHYLLGGFWMHSCMSFTSFDHHRFILSLKDLALILAIYRPPKPKSIFIQEF